jgi:5'-nucleotidase
MRILVANDDGVYSPGIAALAEIASAFGEVRIVAPDVEQSSMGHAITASRPLSITRTHIGAFDAWRVNGTPADCVALGIHTWSQVDVVLSGINLGHNLGNQMWHSGTLAAAKQASLLGVRAIALSADPVQTQQAYGPLKPFARQILRMLLGHAGWSLVNVNFPKEPQGVVWTRQSVRHYAGKLVLGHDPMGNEHYWFTAKPIEAVETGTDRWALQQSLVALTPLRLDLTDEKTLAAAQQQMAFEAHPRNGQLGVA